ncbi:signal transduction histidine kinase [Kroppenstedtia sanguinis]|uniref:sensor histidine kinase n=1 Tax=Kroppenstedtia sanguinis TaxID=1380684 RepID=UPI003D1C8061
MKLFIRDHASILIFFILQLLLISFLHWLDGLNHFSTLLYTMLLSSSLFLVFLSYRYWCYRSVYRRLSHPLQEMDDSVQGEGGVPLEEALNDLLQSQYRHYQDRLHEYERKQRDQVTFITQWVHQMKTPLSVIQLILQNKNHLDVNSLREEVDRIRRGLEIVLYTARLEIFERDFHVEPVPLLRLVHEVIHENKRFFIQNHVYPEVTVDEEAVVESDAKWLKFVLNQLVANAVKYSSGAGKKVTLHSYPRGRNWVLEVKDRGVGIPKQDLRRVFDPYYTGENGRIVSESTGMGLYLVQEVCHKLGHGIEMDSQVGEGTTVRLLFFRSN